MKRVMLGVILGILMFGLVGVFAEGNNINSTNGNNQTALCDSDNLDLCLSETNCIDAEGYWYGGVCNEEEEEDEEEEEGEGKQGLGQTIRNRVEAGVYTSPTGEKIRVRELAQNRFLLQVNNISADCYCELEQEQVQNRTKLKVKLKDGRNVEIKVMPDVASEKALTRLKLKVCSEENNCTITLKEVALKRRTGNKTEETGLAYEMQVQRQAKILWIFRKKMQVQSQVDAETGEIISVKKPWWAFLASEGEE